MDHPYRHLPDAAYWRRSVAGRGAFVDPVAGPFLALSRDDRVATAGSCFAQHIARHLAASGFNYLVTETAHPIVPEAAAKAAGYGLFTARYGNIYTTLQLVQLFDRAYGRFAAVEDVWAGEGGGVLDPFRPTIQPGGFAGEAEMRADRDHHLARVREAFETLDVFVFTLGLTETWVSRVDGAAYPLCPGVAGGAFDPASHAFRNLTAGEVRDQLVAFVERLRGVNPAARIVLTVSPVPLAATAGGGHVLPATVYSKSVLRVAAGEAAAMLPDIFYFPSYEIITGPQARGRFFAEDLREVTEEGVAHVMSVFLRHAAGIEPSARVEPVAEVEDAPAEAARAWVETMCDEAMLDALRPADPPVHRGTARARWLLVSNCQTHGLAASLAALAPDIAIEAHDWWAFERLARAEPDRFREHELALILPELRKLPGFDALPLPRRTAAVPAVEFTAYHPDCCYALVDEAPIAGLIGPYHSTILIAAYKEGLGVAETCRFFAEPVYRLAGYFDHWRPRRELLLRSCAEAGLDLADAFERWAGAGPFMHTQNHPTATVLHDLARAILRREGVAVAEAAPPEDRLAATSWPVYPEIGAALGCAGDYAFVPADRAGPALSLHDYVADGLARLGEWEPSRIGVIPFVRRTALRPIRAAMRER